MDPTEQTLFRFNAPTRDSEPDYTTPELPAYYLDDDDEGGWTIGQDERER